MNEDLQQLHLKAGLKIGKDKTCGNKIDDGSEDTAVIAAEKMNQKPSTRNTLEAYPCAFCHRWHIGRQMSRAELEIYLSNSNIESLDVVCIDRNDKF